MSNFLPRIGNSTMVIVMLVLWWSLRKDNLYGCFQRYSCFCCVMSLGLDYLLLRVLFLLRITCRLTADMFSKEPALSGFATAPGGVS